MDSKKVNLFAFIMMVVVCAISIFTSISNQGADGEDGRNGLSAYELAIKNNIITSDMSEVEYLESLRGKDGSSVTLEDIYEAYLREKGLTSSELTYTEFILTFYPDKIETEADSVSLIENTTQNALRSTVDICYSFYMDTPIIFGQFSNDKFVVSTQNANAYVSIGISAGSGVIYSYEDTDSDGEDDVAYIVTNYHVVYCSNYSNDSNYYVYCDESTGEYFTATYNESICKTGSQIINTIFGPVSQTVTYINKSDMVSAPIYTHFLDNYGVYLYGYQSERYEISASFVGGSANNDLAVLKVERDSTNANNSIIFEESFKPADLGDSREVNEGETIVAVGNPLLVNTPQEYNSNEVAGKVQEIKSAYVDALCLTSTSGEISNLSEYCLFQSLLEPSKTNNMRLIRVSSAINAGNSGGGLYSTDGKLVGIVNGKIESASYDNVGYAIPIDVVKRIVNQVIDQCEGDKTVTRVNAVTTNKLGLKVENGVSNSYYDKDKLQWILGNDVTVSSVSGLAKDAGILKGDVIKSITVGTETINALNDYDINDILLIAKTTDTSISFNISRYSQEIGTETKTITINLTTDCFEEIA